MKSATARWLKTVRKEVRVQSFALVVSTSLCQVFVKFLLADWKSFVDVSLQLGVSSLVVKVSKFLATSESSGWSSGRFGPEVKVKKMVLEGLGR